MDPISDRFAHLSLFNYANNDPVKLIDLHGLQGVKPSVVGILYEGFQNARAGLFNLEMLVIDYFSGGKSSTVPRMRVNYDVFGGISTSQPVSVYQEPRKGALAQAGNIALDIASLTPLVELGAARGMSGPFLAARTGGGLFTRIGRWMSSTEYDAMKESGKVQPGGGGQTFGSTAGPDDFRKTAPKGSVFVEYDVPTNSVLPGGKSSWVKTISDSANNAMKRLLGKQGGTVDPPATNIKKTDEKQ